MPVSDDTFAPCSDLFGMLPIPRRAKLDLASRMEAPGRHYHTLGHLDLLWRRHRQFGPKENVPAWMDPAIAFAIAFHDAIYVPGAGDNETRSAEFFLATTASTGGLTDDDRAWVAHTIRATQDHGCAALRIDPADPRGHARLWVLDLDLTPLGEAADVFDANVEKLAAEISFLSAAEAKEIDVGTLRRFAAAEPLFHTRTLRAEFEGAARRNCARHLMSMGPSSP